MRREQLSSCLWAEVEEAPGLHCVALRGELDISGTRPFTDLVMEIAGSTVIVDLSQVSFIGAAGAGALVALRAAMARRGDDIVVAGASPSLRRVFHLLDLDELIE